MQIYSEAEQLSLFDQDGCAGKTCQVLSPVEIPKGKTFLPYSGRSSELVSVPYLFMDLTPGHGDLLGNSYWELRSPWRGESLTLNTGPAPRSAADVYSLSQILEEHPHRKYYLSRKACLGILRRAHERGKELPPQLEMALMAQAGIIAFAANHGDVVSMLASQLGMKQQTFCLNPWDTQQTRIFYPDGKAPTLAGADGGGGRNPGGLLFTAGFCAGAGPSAGGIGYSEELSPTLKAAESGTNMVPSILCLNDQGGGIMDCSLEVTGTLRSQERGHQPLVYENHGIDSRYTGPHNVAPTMSARYGTGGNNVPLVEQESVLCISGNTIDRQPQNGGNGLGCQEDIAYTLTATDHHAVFSRQRVDVFRDGDVASTESARQHKDATDLVCQPRFFGQSQFESYSEEILPLLIRRLTPLECERLQGFPDGWTDLPGASDSVRYRALGNSVAIPCVEYIMRGIAMVLGSDEDFSYKLEEEIKWDKSEKTNYTTREHF